MVELICATLIAKIKKKFINAKIYRTRKYRLRWFLRQISVLELQSTLREIADSMI